MQRKLLTITALSAVFASFAVAQESGGARDPFQQTGNMPASVEAAPTATVDVAAAPAPASPTGQNEGSWGRDPFSSPFAQETSAPAQREQAPGFGEKPLPAEEEKVLTGIIYSELKRLAIIGGELYREGSTIENNKLVAIYERSVVFENSEGRHTEIFLKNFSIGKK